MKPLWACLLVLLPLVGRADAQPVLDGRFVAARACDATPSIRGGGDGTLLKPGHAYRLIAGNRVPASHYLVEVPGAAPERRWVETACGERTDGASAEATTGGGKPATGGGGTSTRNILAISWQPAFCEGRREKAECRSQAPDRPDALRFSLHGLWPQPRGNDYCGEAAVLKDRKGSTDWRDLPKPEISTATRTKIEIAMPGTQSFLDRHEWARHGSCYGTDAEDYFLQMLALLDEVNASPVADLFRSRIGREVTTAEIRGAFDRAFGAGAGERVRVSCRDDGERRLVDELTIGLVGEVTASPDMPALMGAAQPTKAGCPGGIVDAVGLQ